MIKMVNIKMDEKFINHLKMEGHKISLSRNKTCSLSQIIRETLEEKFPMHKKCK